MNLNRRIHLFQKRLMNTYQGLMNKKVPMVCGGYSSTFSIKKKCYYLGKYNPTNRNVITLQRNTLDHHYE